MLELLALFSNCTSELCLGQSGFSGVLGNSQDSKYVATRAWGNVYTNPLATWWSTTRKLFVSCRHIGKIASQVSIVQIGKWFACNGTFLVEHLITR